MSSENKKIVYLYWDDGVDQEFSGGMLFDAMQDFLAPKGFQSKKIDAAAILRDESWMTRAHGFVIPGGASRPYSQKLDGLGNDRIRAFVRNGGRFLGLCAGAYYACRWVDFEVGQAETEIRTAKELGFFPGKAAGTLHSLVNENEKKLVPAPYDYSLNTSNIMRVILADGGQQPVYPAFYSGGPAFYLDQKWSPEHSDVTESVVMAGRYEGLQDNLTAYTHLDYGKGYVTLCAVHPEVSGEKLAAHLDRYPEKATPILRQLADDLKEIDASRQMFFDRVMHDFLYAKTGQHAYMPDTQQGHAVAIRNA